MKLQRQVQAWYEWYYHPDKQLLLICPADFISRYPVLWPRILKVCQLPSWPSFLSEAHARFIPSEEGLRLLIATFKPSITWMLGYPSHLLPAGLDTNLLLTSADLMHGKTKKEIWLKWMTTASIQAIAC